MEPLRCDTCHINSLFHAPLHLILLTLHGRYYYYLILFDTETASERVSGLPKVTQRVKGRVGTGNISPDTSIWLHFLQVSKEAGTAPALPSPVLGVQVPRRDFLS